METDVTQVTPKGNTDPTPDRRSYYKNVATGDRGYLVKRHGADHMKYDQPGHDRTIPFKSDDWTIEQQSRQLPAHEVAQVAYAADQRLCRTLGKQREAQVEWLTLQNEERLRWVKEGPKAPATSMRARLWRSIVTALVVDG